LVIEKLKRKCTDSIKILLKNSLSLFLVIVIFARPILVQFNFWFARALPNEKRPLLVEAQFALAAGQFPVAGFPKKCFY
jgi:hypothetical protein